MARNILDALRFIVLDNVPSLPKINICPDLIDLSETGAIQARILRMSPTSRHQVDWIKPVCRLNSIVFGTSKTPGPKPTVA